MNSCDHSLPAGPRTRHRFACARGAFPGCRWTTSTVWLLRTARRPGGQQPHRPDTYSNHRRTTARRGRCDRGPVALRTAPRRGLETDNLRTHCCARRERPFFRLSLACLLILLGEATWAAAPKKIYVVTDLEGISGVYQFAQTRETETPLVR